MYPLISRSVHLPRKTKSAKMSQAPLAEHLVRNDEMDHPSAYSCIRPCNGCFEIPEKSHSAVTFLRMKLLKASFQEDVNY